MHFFNKSILGLTKLAQVTVLSLAMAGCFYVPSSKPIMPPTDQNVSERAPDTLAIDVQDFDWIYFNDGLYIRLNGKVQNNSGAPIQAVTLIGAIFDEDGRPMGSAQSYIAPSYLVDGGSGTFEFVFSPARPRDIKHLRLVTRAKTLGY